MKMLTYIQDRLLSFLTNFSFFALTFIFIIDLVSLPHYQIIFSWKRLSLSLGFHEMLAEECPLSSRRFV